MGTSTAPPGTRQRKTVRAGLALVIGTTLVQFVPAPPRSNPPVDRDQTIEANVRLTPEARDVLRRSCGNCHSNETKWPWYSHFAPGSWMVGRHVENGRQALNFSEWRSRVGRKPGAAMASLAGVCAAAQTGRMPPSSYLWLHPEAKLSADDKRVLCSWTYAEISAFMASARSAQRGQNDAQTEAPPTESGQPN